MLHRDERRSPEGHLLARRRPTRGPRRAERQNDPEHESRAVRSVSLGAEVRGLGEPLTMAVMGFLDPSCLERPGPLRVVDRMLDAQLHEVVSRVAGCLLFGLHGGRRGWRSEASGGTSWAGGGGDDLHRLERLGDLRRRVERQPSGRASGRRSSQRPPISLSERREVRRPPPRCDQHDEVMIAHASIKRLHVACATMAASTPPSARATPKPSPSSTVWWRATRCTSACASAKAIDAAKMP